MGPSRGVKIADDRVALGREMNTTRILHTVEREPESSVVVSRTLATDSPSDPPA